MNTKFLFFDDRGYSIQRIEFEFKSFSVVESYFKKISPKHALDVDSQNRIWGALLAFVCNKSRVDILIPQGEPVQEKILHKNMKENKLVI